MIRNKLKISIFMLAISLLMGGFLPFTQARAQSYAEVIDIRTGANDGITRFVIEASRSLPYHIFHLSNPNRVVIDLPELAWQQEMDNLYKIADQNKGIMERFRFGLFKPGITRMVIDLAQEAQVKSHFRIAKTADLSPRLVVDLVAGKAQKKAYQSEDWQGYEQGLANQQISSAPASLTQQDKRRPLIVIDPGHGGVDPGAISRSGNYEKDIVLRAAKIFAARIKATGRYDVILTRDRDIFIPLRQRYETAHKVNADLFISMHADSHNKARVGGVSVYTLSDRASDAETAALARKENKSDIIAGTNLDSYTPEVSSILLDLARQSVNQSSWYFAEMIVETLKPEVKLLNNPHRFAGFAVLKSPNVPSILVELGYLSNPRDEENLLKNDYLEDFAKAFLVAIDRFFERQQRLQAQS